MRASVKTCALFLCCFSTVLIAQSAGQSADPAAANVTNKSVKFKRNFTPEDRKKSMLAPFLCEDNLVYKTVKEPDGNIEKLEFLLVKPKEKKFARAPLLIYTHGGGWADLDRYVLFWPNSTKAVKKITESGIIIAAIEYRVTRVGVSTAYDCVVDCKDAGRYFTANAERFGLDPERIAVWGGSAGGHLCLMTGLAPEDKFPGDPALKGFVPKYRAVCSWFPATSFVNLAALKGSNFEVPGRWISFLGGAYEEKKDLARLLSPVEYLRNTGPNVLLVHGDSDKVLPLAASQYMLAEAQKVGAPVELIVVKGGGHGFAEPGVVPSLDEIQERTADFIINNLIPNGEKTKSSSASAPASLPARAAAQAAPALVNGWSLKNIKAEELVQGVIGDALITGVTQGAAADVVITYTANLNGFVYVNVIDKLLPDDFAGKVGLRLTVTSASLGKLAVFPRDYKDRLECKPGKGVKQAGHGGLGG